METVEPLILNFYKCLGHIYYDLKVCNRATFFRMNEDIHCKFPKNNYKKFNEIFVHHVKAY